jgi:hypothetical protein
MESAKPLRDVFNELVGDESARGALAADRDAVLRDSGHGDLPGGLVAEAVVSYADTAPVEVAEHLAPFVKAHSAVPADGPAAVDPDPATGLDLLATAPAGAPVLGAEPDEGWIDGLESAQTGTDPTYAGGDDIDGLESAQSGTDPTYAGERGAAGDGVVSAETGPDPVYAGPADGFDLAFGAGGGNGGGTGADDGGIADAVPFEPDPRGDTTVPDEPDEPEWTVKPPDLPVGVVPDPAYSDEDTDPTDEEEPVGDGGG